MNRFRSVSVFVVSVLVSMGWMPGSVWGQNFGDSRDPGGDGSAKKSREIVVVGSKVKDVVRSAGFRSDGDLIGAISDKVHEMLEAAIARAGANGRQTVRPSDIDCLPNFRYFDNLIKGRVIRELIRGMGFNASAGLIEGLSDGVHDLLNDGITRARDNGRETVRAHDFISP